MNLKKKTTKKVTKKVSTENTKELFVIAENKEVFEKFVKDNKKIKNALFLHKTKQLKESKGSDVILTGHWFMNDIFTKEGPEMVEYGADHFDAYKKVKEILMKKYEINFIKKG